MLHRFTTTLVRPCVFRTTPRFVFRSAALLSNTSTRSFASSHDWQQGPSHPLIDKIAQHPHIMQQLMDFTGFLQSKGVNLSKQPSFMEIVKIMNDPEVKEKTKKLVQDMQAAGITLDMTAIQELQASLAKQQQNPFEEKNEEKKEDEEKGVLNKVKGLFKK
ncbi:hypothetical protein G6F57_010177 [Rhizopus arrhizus]|uniref:Uncharacterized protein n=1 Tax=Rhizopus oryzae TaxID=64495 RepID=A0A9P6X129_RHIOR|nr:hypothetical protein G6F23_002916 [Rhizopus arrhizus]KAG1411600.1 hypothetical protein G6F58_008475 [Rhizopus delemar]KAG0764175.1 hypothetical protein G6F24_005424 [Rhizopus arrhizus]KAG0789697.1 hypothetical protein G6F22_006625 [Rhizopus arrhizus]KAG0793777.1 hypothetical protein G6F21_003361 [Rhizopus arrhizus]